VPIDRTTITTWEDGRVVDWVRATGKKTLVFAGLWAEVCLVFPVIHALGDGYEVYFVTDASGGTSQEAHEMGIARMIQAAAVPLTTVVFMSELQRDWARTDQAATLSEIILEHGGATATRSPGNGSCSASPPAPELCGRSRCSRAALRILGSCRWRHRRRVAATGAGV
jgi:hypothetical protein